MDLPRRAEHGQVMAVLVVLGFFVLLAVLAPRYGADTRESRQGIRVRRDAN